MRAGVPWRACAAAFGAVVVTACAVDPVTPPAPSSAPVRTRPSLPTSDPLFDDAASFTPLPPPSPTGWRARFPAPGQSYLDYLDTIPRRPREGADRLYLLPMGDLEMAVVADADFVYLVRTPPADAMAELVETFYGVPTSVLPPVDLGSLAEPTRVHRGHEQFRAQDLLTATESLVPDDAFSMTALMVRDVYFNDAQSYGFGYGQHRDGQAVVSFARLDPVVSGHARPHDILDRLPLRGFKLLVHEVGHTFGFEHCTEHRCIMNGFADHEELDATPLHLGPACLRKLLYATEVDPHARYAALEALYARLQLEAPQQWVADRRRRLGARASREPARSEQP